ncbi:unnamed protein product, partial [Candida parapsilosis]
MLCLIRQSDSLVRTSSKLIVKRDPDDINAYQ